ncbi:MAG: HYR domain-containing protein [Verrucomicrobia bacterium]|nr:HYR domain-containing protein [Verrucomicrobiota bacterium]
MKTHLYTRLVLPSAFKQFVAAGRVLLLISTMAVSFSGLAQVTVTPCGFQTLESFEFGDQSGQNPVGLMQASDGAFYGVTELGGSSGLGTVFKLTPDGTGGYTYRVIHDFSSSDGGNANNAIVQGSDGALYGTTHSSGGSVFKLTPDGTGSYSYTTLHTFSGPDGAYPSRVLQGTDGAFYGMTYSGGDTGDGTVFKVNSDGSGFTVLHNFSGSDGSGPGAITGLAQGSDGAIYGTTENGGIPDDLGTPSGFGTVFKMNPDGTGYTVLWNFGLTEGDGVVPIGAVLGTDGALYGVTGWGGSYGGGTVFKLSKDGTGAYVNQVLHSFNGIDGQTPVSEILGPDGALYGTTDAGGSSGAGTVFKMNSDGSGFMLLHNFSGPDGARPASIPVLGTDGAIYGTTYGAIYGGASFGNGTVFRLGPPDTTQPVITCPANITLGCSINLLTPVSFSATAHDNCDPNPTLSYSPASGAGFPVCTTTVTCTATDSSGNQSRCSFTVTRAALNFTGFLSPIGGADATGGSFANPVRTFKLNSTIPVKFTSACGGAPVVSGIHRLQVIKYSNQTTASDPIDATPTDAATTGDQFRLTSGQWQFNLDTKGTGMSTGIWLLRATLSDGSQHSAWIQIK